MKKSFEFSSFLQLTPAVCNFVLGPGFSRKKSFVGVSGANVGKHEKGSIHSWWRPLLHLKKCDLKV